MSILKTIVLVTAFLSCFIGTAIAQAPLEVQKELTPKEQLEVFAQEYGASFTELDRVAKCESGYRMVYGDGGLAYGVFQYHRPTFEAFSKVKGEKLDYYSSYDQMKLTAFIFSKGEKYKYHWSCY